MRFTELSAYWEVYYDPISDDYSPDDPDDPSAVDLFHLWAGKVREEYPDGLIPIYWFVKTEGPLRTFEAIPHQYEHHRAAGLGTENWLTFFTEPEQEEGDSLNWLSVPVLDKLWRPGRGDKGGFIQEATGWKPCILQPFVYLPALEAALSASS